MGLQMGSLIRRTERGSGLWLGWGDQIPSGCTAKGQYPAGDTPSTQTQHCHSNPSHRENFPLSLQERLQCPEPPASVCSSTRRCKTTHGHPSSPTAPTCAAPLHFTLLQSCSVPILPSPSPVLVSSAACQGVELEMSRPFPSSVWLLPWCVSTKNSLCKVCWKKRMQPVLCGFGEKVCWKLLRNAGAGVGRNEGFLHPLLTSLCPQCFHLA